MLNVAAYITVLLCLESQQWHMPKHSILHLNHGKDIYEIVVDFNDAQARGIETVMGPKKAG